MFLKAIEVKDKDFPPLSHNNADRILVVESGCLLYLRVKYPHLYSKVGKQGSQLLPIDVCYKRGRL
jgi:hypothetical protein